MQTTQYSPEPARDQFIDRHEEISYDAILTATCLFEPEDFDNRDRTIAQSNTLFGAALYAGSHTADGAFFEFLNATTIEHLC